MGKPLEARVGGPNSLGALDKMGFSVDSTHPSFERMTEVPHRRRLGNTLTYEDMIQPVPVHPIVVTDYTDGEARGRTVFKPTNRALREITGGSR